jgi:anthranilate synthase component 1
VRTHAIQPIPVDPGFDLLDLHACHPQRYPHLLESAAHGDNGRFDILFAFPADSIALRDIGAFDFLERLDATWRQSSSAVHVERGDLPFGGGWFIYLGYELAAQIEPQLRLPQPASRFPVAMATRFPAALIHDHRHKQRWLVSEQQHMAELVQSDIATCPRGTLKAPFPDIAIREDAPEPYLAAVERVLRYIVDGDVFQVNLSRQWQSDWPDGVASAALYRRLRKTNPGPFNGLATWGNVAIFSSSPERLVRVRGDMVETRPIAGTRPRGEIVHDDEAFSSELLGHPKERAEHIMLIDLERNDLGRIAVPGTVEVSELMVLESYATVHHIVSNVRAKMRPGTSPGTVIRAVFPGGTITGCPKVRCMEIIAELESTGRGAYTGSMGYLNHDGSMDLNILIRSLVRDGIALSFRAGAGIVADSIPWRELEETRAKAGGMLRALRS